MEVINNTLKKLYLKKLRILKPLRKFTNPFEIEFDCPLTMIIGDNGTGKSTILDMIREGYSVLDSSCLKEYLRDYFEIEGEELSKERIKYFDFHSSDRKFASNFGEDFYSQISAIHMSSSEGLALQLKSTGIFDAKDSLIILDEVARGGSIRIQVMYARFLSKLALENQVIASTNEYITMNVLSNNPDCRFYSIEDRKYISLEDFIKKQLSLEI